MPLTLWRGEELLGKLLERFPSRNARSSLNERGQTLIAVMIPTREMPELGDGVWQVNWPAGELGVQQIRIDTDVMADVVRDALQSGSGALEPLSPERVSTVPRKHQLTVRDELGHVFLPWRIRVERVRYGNERGAISRNAVPPEALVNGSIWEVLIAFAPEPR
jgi:hypothetical protein